MIFSPRNLRLQYLCEPQSQCRAQRSLSFWSVPGIRISALVWKPARKTTDTDLLLATCHSRSQSLRFPWPAFGKLNGSGRLQNRNQEILVPVWMCACAGDCGETNEFSTANQIQTPLWQVFRKAQRSRSLGADQKDRGLWGRDWKLFFNHNF